MDWNVFFSTISQTSGAIVGIFSAFLITKIVSNQTDFAKLKNEAIHNLIDSRTLEAELSIRDFVWYNDAVRDIELRRIEKDFIDSLDENLWEGDLIMAPKEYILKYDFSIFEHPNELLSAVRTKISELRSKLEQRKERDDNPSPFHSFAAHMMEGGLYHDILNQPPYALIENEKKQIEQLIIKTERQARRNTVLEIELRQGIDSINLVTNSIVAVLILFFSGVIYPLSFLPWDEGREIHLSISAFFDILFSLQGFMLSLISITFSGLMLVFLIINSRLKHSSELRSDVAHYCDISNYSPFLSNYMKNKGKPYKN
ncbi:hypothetical protein HNP12_000966 [Aeromonas hydrophila]|uniref:hypothetical protein n=1 Tax=Aeromonas hydrophila TaxID=644 RepID=UPI00216948CD|nr:hypothetical protein [Aeromonas hydrophila]MCS3766918.1 hypothetical protein [Aeromonas hydrophila]MCS3793065.1 hypothetical protein [Aeromonas hydrophila]